MALPVTVMIRFFQPFQRNIVFLLFSLPKREKEKTSLPFFVRLVSTNVVIRGDFFAYHATVDVVPKRF